MRNKWESALPSLSKVIVYSTPDNEPVRMHGVDDSLRCIGVGTDAAVFQSIYVPEYAFKVYAEEKASKIKIEEAVYSAIGDSPFFPTCYGAEDRVLVLSFEEGPTLFDCLLQGIHIPKQAIQDVEEARQHVRDMGMNPRDIHLKNILLQNGRSKIIDVSEYVLPGNDFRWEHLKKAYEEHYHLLEGRAVPFWLLETIRKWYHSWSRHFTTFDDFMKIALKFLPSAKD
ncbi:serine/threonine protein kinase (plasmid) [Cytobacillus spongiae]|uniref:serine/threonine protein kinase n=1 Tax=Cytobacillus spongiae TaxID=2901381 RepID=UPI00145D81CA|nr:serine/threonine protein kinase [Cytobacillus spongiae]MCA1062649.1 serine/threonine protein kinase [Rossellomorea aquimaris]NMH69993.1 serine/threonine protein kinase [Bacillus sp. RO3]UII58285.1 serine/threonine protein kinase [Cytobacillus spongiae]WJV28686.1 serine/threonine protein kinase [Rossellomorea sp. AcN35-11]